MCADCSEPIHHQFGLTYANYFVWQRSILQAMPIEWQRKFVALIDELAERAPDDRPDAFWVRATDGGKFVTDPYAQYRHTRVELKDAKEAAHA